MVFHYSTHKIVKSHGFVLLIPWNHLHAPHTGVLVCYCTSGTVCSLPGQHVSILRANETSAKGNFGTSSSSISEAWTVSFFIDMKRKYHRQKWILKCSAVLERMIFAIIY